MRILVISTSLRPASRSRVMARACLERVQAHLLDTVGEAEWLDLAELDDIPFCDADDCWNHPTTARLRDTVERADGIVLATPIYNYSISSSAKNLVELTGRQWEGKVVGFINAAGGTGSFMSVMATANSLMLDYRCIIVPRMVFATGRSFDGDHITDEDLGDRIEALALDLIRIAGALAEG